MSTRPKLTNLLFGLAGAMVLAGCHTDMWVQPKTNYEGESEFFDSKSASQPILAHTVARGHLRGDDAFFTGASNGKWLTDLPLPVTKDLLLRGQERFNIYCSPCHGRLGDGNGMIAQRGFALRRPVASYHTDRLRNMPIGHFYDVITNGYGTMFSYASRVEPQDRWAIAAYIRVLQLSQHAASSDVDPAELSKVQNETTDGKAVAQR